VHIASAAIVERRHRAVVRSTLPRSRQGGTSGGPAAALSCLARTRKAERDRPTCRRRRTQEIDDGYIRWILHRHRADTTSKRKLRSVHARGARTSETLRDKFRTRVAHGVNASNTMRVRRKDRRTGRIQDNNLHKSVFVFMLLMLTSTSLVHVHKIQSI